MAKRIRNNLAMGMSDLQRELWKMGTVPYNTVVILITTALMIESQAWKLREESAA